MLLQELLIILGLVLRFTSVGQTAIGPGLAFLGFLQFSALVLNLIPLPPFDGYGAIEPYLPIDWRMRIVGVSGMLMWVVFLVLWYVDFVNRAFWGLVVLLTQVAGIPGQMIILGFSQFRFWN